MTEYTKEQAAFTLNGLNREDLGLSPDFIRLMAGNELVIIYGGSDDLIILEGAINDEFGAFEGSRIYITEQGKAIGYNDKTKKSTLIEAIWGKDYNGVSCSWQYKTKLPHAPFSIYDEGELWCVGIVIDLKEVKEKVSSGCELIALERKKQIEKHGYTIEHDAKQNDLQQLRQVAAYLIYSNNFIFSQSESLIHAPNSWNQEYYSHLRTLPDVERLTIAGALIAAEIDRLNYEANKKAQNSCECEQTDTHTQETK